MSSSCLSRTHADPMKTSRRPPKRTKRSSGRAPEQTLCPVCGFDLGFRAWDGDLQSDEICPCCGIQFGYHDLDPQRRRQVHLAYREKWVASGMRWWSDNPPPPNWDPAAQLSRVAKAVD